MADRLGCQRIIAVAVATLLVSVAWASNAASPLRGVSPAHTAVYSTAQASGNFECYDGSKRVPITAVNDNYCDCPDGSDEPGTSACSGGTFYCRNRGHQPLTLTSSFVDDNICDCCDGSDEAPGTCKNTCVEKGAAAREALRTAAKEAGAGNKIRRQRIRDAAGKKAQWRDKVEALKKQEVALQPQVDRLSRAKQAAEDRESAARERKQKADEARAAAEKKRQQAELKKAQATVTQEAQDQQAADEASKLAEPVPQHAQQASGGVEQGQAAEAAVSDAAGGTEKMVSPEQAAVRQGVSIDTSAEALQKANEAMQKALGRTAEELLAEADGKKAASAQAAADAAAGEGDVDPNEGAKSAELAAGASGRVHVDSDPDALAKANLLMQEALAKQGKSLDDLKAEGQAAEAQGQKQKTDEELAQERMSQWVKSDDGAQAAEGSEAAAEPEAEEADAEQVEAEAGGPAEEEIEVDEEEAAEEEALEQEAAPPSDPSMPTLKPGLGGPVAKGINWLMGLFAKKPVETAELERLEAAAAKARDACSAKSDRLAEAQKEFRELQERLERDYGPDDAFLALEGQCFTATAEKYTYEVCPFGGAAQKDGGSSTSLGSFQRFEGDYSAMAFESGAACWSGPARSIKVHLECGAKESLSAISEPSRCVYAARLATPSLCTKTLQDKWQAEADAAQAELDSIGKDEL